MPEDSHPTRPGLTPLTLPAAQPDPAERPPDSIHGRSIELPQAAGPTPELARPPSRAPRSTFDPRVVIPMDLLDPHLPSSKEISEKVKAARKARRRLLLAVAGGLGGGLALACLGLLVWHFVQAAPAPVFDPGIGFAIDSEPPGAAVSIDGRPTQSVTPMRLNNWDYALPHHLRFDLKGYYPEDRVVAAGPNPPDLVIKMPRLARFEVRSTPPGAAVFLADRQVGASPVQFEVPADRDLSIAVRLQGYLPQTEHVLLQADESRMRDFFLHAMAILAVRTEPAGARVTLDALAPVTSPADFSVEAGVPHQLLVVALGLPAQKRTLTLKEGQRQEVNVRIEGPGDRRARAKIALLQHQEDVNQRRLDQIDARGGSSDMFATFGRLKNEDRLSDTIDREEAEEQRLSEELSQHQVELEDEMKAANLKDGVPAGAIIPVAKPDDAEPPE